MGFINLKLAATTLWLLPLLTTSAQGEAPDGRPTPADIDGESQVAKSDDGATVPDLSGYDRDTLQRICEQLYRVNAVLQQQLQDLESVKRYLQEKGLLLEYLSWSGDEKGLRKAQEARAMAAREEARRTRIYHRIQTIKAEQAEQERLRVQGLEAEREAQPATLTAAQEAPKWDTNYYLEYIRYQGSEIIYLDANSGEMLRTGSHDLDRYNVRVRGTFTNLAAVPYRYTFEIRVGGKQAKSIFKGPGKVIGSWTYQTPLLDSNELHNFEVKVPVTDISDVVGCEIGNVQGVRPTGQ